MLSSKRGIVLMLLLVLGIALYQNQKNTERAKTQERYAREKEQCVKIFKARFGDWPSTIPPSTEASTAAAAREFNNFRLDHCITNRMSEKEASEPEKAKELETEARTSCAHQANIASEREGPGGLLPLKFKTLHKTDQEIESIYRLVMRACMETRGFEYTEGDLSPKTVPHQSPQTINSPRPTLTPTQKRLVPVTLTSPLTNGTFYCYEDKANELVSLQSTIGLAKKSLDYCISNGMTAIDNCLNNCKTSRTCLNNCKTSTTNAEEFISCTNNCSSGFDTCIDNCGKNMDTCSKEKEQLKLLENGLFTKKKQYCP